MFKVSYLCWMGAALLVGATAAGCGQPAEAFQPTTGTGTGAGGATSTSSSSSTGEGGSGATTTSSGTGGTAGEGGAGTGGGGAAGPVDYGPNAHSMVSAGLMCSSPKYKMVFTLGQPSFQQGKAESPSYRLQGGLIGATGTLP